MERPTGDGSAKSRRCTLLRLNLRSLKPSQYEQRRPGRREEDRRHAKPDKDDEGGREGRAPARIAGAEASEARRSANRNGMFVVRSTSLLLPCVREAPGARVCQRERVVCEQACFSPLPACRPAGKTIPPTAHRTGSESESAPPPMGRNSAVT